MKAVLNNRRRGAVMLFFLLISLPILFVGMVFVDVGRVSTVRADVNHSLNVAAHAGSLALTAQTSPSTAVEAAAAVLDRRCALDGQFAKWTSCDFDYRIVNDSVILVEAPSARVETYGFGLATRIFALGDGGTITAFRSADTAKVCSAANLPAGCYAPR